MSSFILFSSKLFAVTKIIVFLGKSNVDTFLYLSISINFFCSSTGILLIFEITSTFSDNVSSFLYHSGGYRYF